MKSLSVLLSVFISFNVFAGQDGGGGDAIYCTASGDAFNYDGHYLLDYVMKQDSSNWVYKKDQMEHLNFIYSRLELLAQYNPRFTNHNVKLFIHEFERKLNGVLNVWIAADLPLKDIRDEQIPTRFQFPRNCNTDKIYQVATKVSDTRYFYDVKMEEALMKDPSGLQINIRNVHELLRSITYDSTQIRKWIRLLHRPDFEERISTVKSAHNYLPVSLDWTNFAAKQWLQGEGHFYDFLDNYHDRVNETYRVEEELNLILDKVRFIDNYKLNQNEKARVESSLEELDDVMSHIIWNGHLYLKVNLKLVNDLESLSLMRGLSREQRTELISRDKIPVAKHRLCTIYDMYSFVSDSRIRDCINRRLIDKPLERVVNLIDRLNKEVLGKKR